MTRFGSATFCGLFVAFAAACSGGGSPSDVGIGPSDEAPTDPGAPSDPNAPPGDREAPPFGGVAPPGSDLPPTGGGGSVEPPDCESICDEAAMTCDVENSDIDCGDICDGVPGECTGAVRRYV